MSTAPIDPALVERLRAHATRVAGARPGPVSAQVLREEVERLIADERRILTEKEHEDLVQAVVDEALGLGPLEPLLRDPEITEIMVVGPERVFVERSGRVAPAPARFHGADHLLHVVDRILSPLGRRVDEASPMVDARLPDGSRVNVVIPPVAVDGPMVTIRRFSTAPINGDDLVRLGTLTAEMRELLATAVRARRNVLVSGGTGSGKTTTLAALAASMGAGERIVTIEDAAELRLELPHVVRLESRPPSLAGSGAVPIRALVRNALRMRPDRIVVGEVRGGEALDMLQAMTTGHDGSLSTIHASSPEDAVRRLQTLALMGDLDLPYRAIAEQVASAIDVVVHLARLADGARRVVEIASVCGGDEGPELESLVRWRTRGYAGHRLEGEFEITAAAERWLAGLRRDAETAVA